MACSFALMKRKIQQKRSFPSDKLYSPLRHKESINNQEQFTSQIIHTEPSHSPSASEIHINSKSNCQINNPDQQQYPLDNRSNMILNKQSSFKLFDDFALTSAAATRSGLESRKSKDLSSQKYVIKEKFRSFSTSATHKQNNLLDNFPLFNRIHHQHNLQTDENANNEIDNNRFYSNKTFLKFEKTLNNSENRIIICSQNSQSQTPVKVIRSHSTMLGSTQPEELQKVNLLNQLNQTKEQSNIQQLPKQQIFPPRTSLSAFQSKKRSIQPLKLKEDNSNITQDSFYLSNHPLQNISTSTRINNSTQFQFRRSNCTLFQDLLAPWDSPTLGQTDSNGFSNEITNPLRISSFMNCSTEIFNSSCKEPKKEMKKMHLSKRKQAYSVFQGKKLRNHQHNQEQESGDFSKGEQDIMNNMQTNLKTMYRLPINPINGFNRTFNSVDKRQFRLSSKPENNNKSLTQQSASNNQLDNNNKVEKIPYKINENEYCNPKRRNILTPKKHADRKLSNGGFNKYYQDIKEECQQSEFDLDLQSKKTNQSRSSTGVTQGKQEIVHLPMQDYLMKSKVLNGKGEFIQYAKQKYLPDKGLPKNTALPFFNAIIQALRNLAPLRQYLKSPNRTVNNLLIESLALLFEALDSNETIPVNNPLSMYSQDLLSAPSVTKQSFLTYL